MEIGDRTKAAYLYCASIECLFFIGLGFLAAYLKMYGWSIGLCVLAFVSSWSTGKRWWMWAGKLD